MADQSKDPSLSRRFTLMALLVWSLIVVAAIHPDFWWGLHFLAFVPSWLAALLLLTSLALLLAPRISDMQPLLRVNWQFTPALIAFAMGGIFYFFPIYLDTYGDAIWVRDTQDEVVTQIPADMQAELRTWTLHPSRARSFMLSAISTTAYHTGSSLRQVYVAMGLVCGVLFVWFWLQWVQKKLHEPLWRWTMTVVGLSAPFLAAFCGHLEVYAPIYLLLLLWLQGLLRYLEDESPIVLALLLPFTVLLMRMHPLGWFLLPVWGLALLWRWRHRHPWVARILRPQGVLLLLGVPAIVGGSLLYFVVTGDFRDDRTLHETAADQHLFLPIVTPDPPYDRYNLQSFNHIADFANAMLFWSVPCWLLLAMVWFGARKAYRWSEPSLLFTAAVLGCFIAFLFVINPILTLPMDWDLYAVSAPVLLVFTLLVVKEVQHDARLRIHGFCFAVGIGILSTPFIFINASKDMYSQRLQSVAMHVYRTYYEWSGIHMDFALGLVKDDPDQYLWRQAEVITEIEQFAHHPLDERNLNYLQLLSIYGRSVLQHEKDLAKAMPLLQKVHRYYPQDRENLMRLLEVNFRLQRFGEAHDNAVELVSIRYPSHRKALRMAIHCAIEAERREAVQQHTTAFLSQWPEDLTIQRVQEGLRQEATLATLAKLFASSN